MRRLVVGLLTAGLLLLWASPALAHAVFMPAEVEGDGITEAELVLAHGCGEEGEVPTSADDMAPIVGVTVEVPTGASLVPGDKDGWTAAVTGEGDHEVVRWEVDDPDDGVDAGLRFDVEVVTAGASAGDELWFTVVQDCVDGTSMTWSERGNPAEVTYPAAGVTVVGQERSGLPTWMIVALAVGLGGLAAAGVFMLSGRET